MAADQMKTELVAMLSEVVPSFSYSPGDEGTPLADLGVDSLDVAGFLLKIEETYGVSVSDEELENLHTLNDYVSFIGAANAA